MTTPAYYDTVDSSCVVWGLEQNAKSSRFKLHKLCWVQTTKAVAFALISVAKTLHLLKLHDIREKKTQQQESPLNPSSSGRQNSPFQSMIYCYTYAGFLHAEIGYIS